MIYLPHMKRAAALLLAVLACAGAVRPARALDPKQLETDWKWDTYFSSFSDVTSKTVDPGGYASVGYSSVTANVVARYYKVYAQGASAQWRVAHTTRTFSAAVNPTPATSQVPAGWTGSAYAAAISTTPLLGVPASVLYEGNFWALTTNPVFYFESLTTSATYWLWVEIGRPKNGR